MNTLDESPIVTPRHSVSDEAEAQLFWRMRLRIGRTYLRQVFRTARLRSALIVGLSLLFWSGLFVLFYQGFYFVKNHVGGAGDAYHAQTFKLVFHLFFASLNLMLVFSSGIILYGTLFRSPECRLLLTLPVRDERITLHKFQEALMFSCWGFFLLASPMMLAYGIVVQAQWYYYALMVPMIVAFVYIPCALGAVSCLLLVAKFPKMKLAIVAAVAMGAIVAAGRAIWNTVSGPQIELFGNEWFQQTIRRFQFTQQEWLPSSWLSNGLLEAGRTLPASSTTSGFDLPLVQGCMYLAVLIMNAMICHLLVVKSGKAWLREAYSTLECAPKRNRKIKVARIDTLLYKALFAFPQPVRLLLVKDWRLLRRDPVQWSQFLIFFGLLGLYFLNLDRFRSQGNDLGNITWVNMVSFLNLAVVGLILSTFTTRFIFPMISLEGQRFWVLGLLPLPRETILWSKFVFAALGSWVPCAALILASDLMLRIDLLVVGVHQFTCLLLCVGLASIAVGLGAIMPDFREPSPSKIAAGFGGTLNLVLSALYIILIVVCTALPCHFYLIAGRGKISETFLHPDQWRHWLVYGTGTALLIAAVATIVPLAMGLRAFRRLELS
jgi:ABC-2 type transport system permease protein